MKYSNESAVITRGRKYMEKYIKGMQRGNIRKNRQHILMIEQDLRGRLIQRVELVSLREQYTQILHLLQPTLPPPSPLSSPHSPILLSYLLIFLLDTYNKKFESQQAGIQWLLDMGRVGEFQKWIQMREREEVWRENVQRWKQIEIYKDQYKEQLGGISRQGDLYYQSKDKLQHTEYLLQLNKSLLAQITQLYISTT